jgi:hypothetical protein
MSTMSTAGVGMGLTRCDRGLEITEILPNGPVHRAGKVRIGDILKKVDGKVVGDTVSSAKELLIGPLGSTVTLTVLRHSPFGMPDAISVCVVRGSATIAGLERPDSGNLSDRPQLPDYYTPFAGNIVGKLDEYSSTIHGFVRQYGGPARPSSGVSSGGAQSWLAEGAKARRATPESGLFLSLLGGQAHEPSTAAADSRDPGAKRRDFADHRALSPYEGANALHGRISSIVSEHARRALQDTPGSRPPQRDDSAKLEALQEQLDKAERDLEQERASKQALELDLASLQRDNAELEQQVGAVSSGFRV